MSLKYFLATFALIALTRGETIDEVIADLAPKVEALRASIDEAITQKGHQIGQTRASIGKSVTIGETSLSLQLNQLADVVNQAKAEAAQKDKNIDACIDASNSALLFMDLNALDKCRINEALDILGLELGQLGRVKGTLSGAISQCSRAHVNDAAGLRTCIEGEIEKAQNASEGIKNDIDDRCERAKKNSQACVDATLSELDQAIDKIAHDFGECVKKIL